MRQYDVADVVTQWLYNDLTGRKTAIFKFNCLHFAYDLKVFRSICSSIDVHIVDNGTTITSWCWRNLLLYNSEFFWARLLQRRCSLGYGHGFCQRLGRFVWRIADFTLHLDGVVAKAGRMLLLSSCLLLHQFFLCYLLYYDVHVHINQLKRIQTKFVKI